MTAIGTAVGALGTVVTAVIAGYVAATWQKNLRKTTKHDIATEVLQEARLFRYLFYDARNPFVGASEFPPGYYATKERSNTQEAKGWAAVYENRWKLLEPQMLVLARLRARAGAALGDQIADAIEQLAKKGRELHGFFEEDVSFRQDGSELVNQYPDQGWVKRVKASVKADASPATRDDLYSKEFEEKFAGLEALVRPYI